MVHLIRNCVFFFTTLEFFCWQLDLDKGCDHLIWHPVFSETDSLPYACLQHLPVVGPRKDVVQRRSEVSGAQFFTSLFGNSLLGPWIYWDGHWRNGNQEGIMARWQSCKWQVTCHCWADAFRALVICWSGKVKIEDGYHLFTIIYFLCHFAWHT